MTSHPIQYQAPWFRALAQVTDLEVFFCHRQDAEGQAAAGFGVAFDWDVPLLDGYKSAWLHNVARQPDVSRFSGCDTPEIAQRLRDGRFDACVVSGWYLKSYLQAIWACKQANIPIVMRGDSQLATRRSAAWTLAKYWPYRWLLRGIDAHLYVGQANRDYLKHFGVADSRLFFAPHFVDNAFFSTRADAARRTGDAAEVRRLLGIPERAMVFAFAGKLIDKKRPADMVRALAAARASGADFWGMIVGSGPLSAELEALVSSLAVPVKFAGFRNQTELPRYFAAADVLVLPSDARETWGLVVNEAMACGLSVIVSSAAGCARDLVDDNCTGYQFSVGNVTELSVAMARVADSVTHNRDTVQKAIATKISQYSCEAAVLGTVAALDAVTARAAIQQTTPVSSRRVS